MRSGTIQQSLSGFYDIWSNGKLYRTRARGNFRKRGLKPVVGDQVEFEAANQQEGYLLKILPRKNQLVRPMVANVDLAVVVTAVKEPTMSTNLLDRQLVALESQKIDPIIYFSKTDLLSDEEESALMKIVAGYREIGYPVVYQRPPFGTEALDELRSLLSGKVVTLMGQTGAGKSTLLNHLAPDLKLATGEISQALKRGKHTTRKVSLMQVGDALIADTPGFSSYEDFKMTVQELPNLFPEMRALVPECKFRGCLHIKEPSCAVKNALEHGKIMTSRYDNYLQFHELIANQKPNYQK
ncbi:MAG: ribosome small subunit-dependent GTPase A [Limosilactobacillus gorillae]|uniref:ribosome small subunit-dependent GTPase A n=1 Tax=Limosilactobacillus gorillae TaxID=1450649 RepID=UPI000A75EFF4|nr:ribosome small subunit-dependent GTPase A [Limosilactobacillus gorillae]MDO4855367.1 ribosome small subunit-dependent GTPase A [Limosilactobacillus gorillae]